MLMVKPTSSKLLLFHLYVTCCFLFSYLVPHHVVAAAAASPFSFSFDFSNRSTYHLADLQFQGDAIPLDGQVDLTCNSMVDPFKNCTGQMSYKYPVPFYDTTTGEVASFTMRFKFAMKGGVMVFFLSSYPSRFHGGDPHADRFITVEFGTYRSKQDPCDTLDHIAIDIGTVMDSVKATCLPSSTLEGPMTASIIFDNSTNMLLASLHFDDNPSRGSYQVSMHLPNPVTSFLLPEVAVGFSAATGSSLELLQILSWCFESTLSARTATGTPETQPKPAPVVPKKETSARAAQPNSAELITRKGAPEAQRKRALMVTAKDQTITAVSKINQTTGSDAQPTSQTGGADAPPTSQTDIADAPPSYTSTANENYTSGIVGPTVTVVLVLCILVWAILSKKRWKRKHHSFARKLTGLKRFDYKKLAVATGRFSKDNKLGEGAFGAVYKGSYTDENGRQEVAVKKMKQTIGEAGGFMAEVKTTSGTRHKNLVELRGWCCSRNKSDLIGFMCWCRQQSVKLFLVYELVPNGTLDDHLHHGDKILPWEKRYQIVKGIGSALRYLHHQCSEYILHRDIKPSNILLDYDFNPKLADFGLSRTTGENNTSLMTLAIGTEGYMDPQCRKHGKVEFTRKSDVYGFGIVLLEIACTDKSREQVWELHRGSAEDLKVINSAADSKLGGVFDETQMARVIVLGLKCSHPDGKQRPYMEDAMKFLEDGIELPYIAEIEGQQSPLGNDQQALFPSRLRS